MDEFDDEDFDLEDEESTKAALGIFSSKGLEDDAIDEDDGPPAPRERAGAFGANPLEVGDRHSTADMSFDAALNRTARELPRDVESELSAMELPQDDASRRAMFDDTPVGPGITYHGGTSVSTPDGPAWRYDESEIERTPAAPSANERRGLGDGIEAELARTADTLRADVAGVEGVAPVEAATPARRVSLGDEPLEITGSTNTVAIDEPFEITASEAASYDGRDAEPDADQDDSLTPDETAALDTLNMAEAAPEAAASSPAGLGDGIEAELARTADTLRADVAGVGNPTATPASRTVSLGEEPVTGSPDTVAMDDAGLNQDETAALETLAGADEGALPVDSEPAVDDEEALWSSLVDPAAAASSAAEPSGAEGLGSSLDAPIKVATGAQPTGIPGAPSEDDINRQSGIDVLRRILHAIGNGFSVGSGRAAAPFNDIAGDMRQRRDAAVAANSAAKNTANTHAADRAASTGIARERMASTERAAETRAAGAERAAGMTERRLALSESEAARRGDVADRRLELEGIRNARANAIAERSLGLRETAASRRAARAGGGGGGSSATRDALRSRLVESGLTEESADAYLGSLGSRRVATTMLSNDLRGGGRGDGNVDNVIVPGVRAGIPLDRGEGARIRTRVGVYRDGYRALGEIEDLVDRHGPETSINAAIQAEIASSMVTLRAMVAQLQGTGSITEGEMPLINSVLPNPSVRGLTLGEFRGALRGWRRRLDGATSSVMETAGVNEEGLQAAMSWLHTGQRAEESEAEAPPVRLRRRSDGLEASMPAARWSSMPEEARARYEEVPQ